MMMKRHLIAGLACGLMVMDGAAQAQLTGTTNLKVSVVSEAALSVTTTNTSLTTTAGTFAADFGGTTSFTYKIRQGTATTANISLKVTTDFAPAGGPSVGTLLTSTDALTYTCTATATSGAACGSAQTASLTTGTPVVTFGADARSSKAGDSGSVIWTLPNDPLYKVNDYTALVTLTISLT